VAKFHGDRLRDRGDLALNKKRKEKKETAAKHKGRGCVIAAGGPKIGQYWRIYGQEFCVVFMTQDVDSCECVFLFIVPTNDW